MRLAIPASFDPAPLLYPSVITLVVSLLVSVDNLAIVLPNVILAICSLPDQLVPTANGLELYNPSHWVLTCIPLLTSNCSQAVVHADVALSKPLFAGPATGELSVLLYPLHRSLCSVLHYLATTSLLPTELQLLSIALINTLFFSVSPQAVILKALLWVGGLCLLVLCGHVIQWGIALARVPRWRFRKASKPAQQRRSLLRQMLAMLRPMRNRKLDAFGEPLDSETADSWNGSDSADGVFYKPSLRKRTTLLGWPMADTTGAPSTATLAAPTVEDAPASPATDRREGTNVSDVEPLTHTQAHVRVSEQTQQLKPSSGGGGRRHTLPSVRSGHPPARGTHGASGQRRRRRRRAASGTVRSFFALTEAQAATRRWAYAGYVYACILFAIAFIVRPYVGRFALDGNEPVGWALGYLFGDLRRFRLEVVKANLERWIRLPARQVVLPSSMDDQGEGWVQRLRLATPPDGIGSANARLLLSAYWAFCVAAGLATVTRLSAVVEVDTRRKVFHFTVVAMFLPATFVDPCYTALALGLVLAIFLLLDLLRASQLPPLSRPLATFLAPYVDGRDLRGPVVVSHVFLLIGCAVPLWLSLASLPRSSSSIVATTGTNDVGDSSEPDPFAGWDLPVRETAMVAGVACVGLGDAAASLVGRRFGRNRWLWPGGKSLQGSAAFFAASFVGLVASAAWLRIGGWRTTADASGSGGGGVGAVASVGNAAVCAALASMTEAVLTGGNDNVIVPVVLWACVKSLGV